jgi:hypothetical protein
MYHAGMVSVILMVLNFLLQEVSILEVHQHQPSASLLGHLAVLHFSLVCLYGVISLSDHLKKFCLGIMLQSVTQFSVYCHSFSV